MATTPRTTPRKLYYPSGPLTKRHTKNREWLVSGNADPVWPKSGAPTFEARKQAGETVKPLFDPNDSARQAGKAVVEMRRDINVLLGPKKKMISDFFEVQPKKSDVTAQLAIGDDLSLTPKQKEMAVAAERQQRKQKEDLVAADIWDSLQYTAVSPRNVRSR
eukprot:TRINITY_DN22048_c0_g1_i1.p1 TRINITY_DN22048_c0_g1~~TRINITY_DN22048_c0_g1_i1.p1  ORF type:complete len:162 (+),score=19.60 TRINITY_DN22048_c0_g1_i1:92-577(+)